MCANHRTRPASDSGWVGRLLDGRTRDGMPALAGKDGVGGHLDMWKSQVKMRGRLSPQEDQIKEPMHVLPECPSLPLFP